VLFSLGVVTLGQLDLSSPSINLVIAPIAVL
jgi:hypothetical protein